VTYRQEGVGQQTSARAQFDLYRRTGKHRHHCRSLVVRSAFRLTAPHTY